MKKISLNIEQIFHNIHKRLLTNDWKIMVTFGDVNNRLSMFEDMFNSNDEYDFTSDEILIEKIPNTDSKFFTKISPIMVACMKREANINYEKYSKETRITERKDFETYTIGKNENTTEELKKFESETLLRTNWFFKRLQFYIDGQNQIDSDMKHESLSEITSVPKEFRNVLLCKTIRLDSVHALGLIEEELLSMNEAKNKDRLVLDENIHFSKSVIDKFIKILDGAIILDNQNFVAWQWKGYFLYKNGSYDEAEQCYQSVNMINPEWTDALFYEGKMKILQGFPQRGLEKINKAIIQQPEKISYRVFKANVLKNIENYSDAVIEYDIARSLFDQYDDYPISYLRFILVSEYFCLQKINQIEKAKKLFESIKKIIDEDAAPKSIDELYYIEEILPKASDIIENDLELNNFILSEDVADNIKRITNIFKNLNEFLWWKDQYWSKKAFDWIEEACLTNNSIKQIKILSSFEKKEEYVNRPFKKRMDRIKNDLKEKSVDIELRIVTDPKLKQRFHGRFIIAKNIIYTVPSVNNFCSGTDDIVAPIPIKIEDTNFELWWKQSLDYYEYYKKEGTFQNEKNA